MPTKVGAIGDAGHGELRLIEKLRSALAGRGHLRWRSFRGFECQVKSLGFFRSNYAGADYGLAESRHLHAQHINSLGQPRKAIASGSVRVGGQNVSAVLDL